MDLTHNQWARAHPTAYFFLDLAVNLIIIGVLVIAIRTYIVSPFQVFGPSMCDTLNSINGQCQNAFGEYLIVKKGSYRSFFGKKFGDPQRGDIIVFKPPIESQEEFYIKRIIGLPGERVEIDDGKVYIYPAEGTARFALDEAYLNELNKNNTLTYTGRGAKQYPLIPEGHYFVMGDNRRKSTDSRTCFQAPSQTACEDTVKHFLPRERIAGKTWFVLWPFEQARFLKGP